MRHYQKILVLALCAILPLLSYGCLSKKADPSQKEKTEITDDEEIRNEENECNNSNAKDTPGNRLGNTFSNIGHLGHVAQEGEWIYYANSSDDWKLYKIKTDGTQKTKLTDHGVIYINVLDDWLYFAIWVFNEPLHIVKMKTDGSSESTISEDPATAIIVVDDWIYYCNYEESEKEDQTISYRIRTDGSNKTRVDINSRWETIADNYFYYTDNNEGMLFRKDLDGNNSILLINDEVEFFDVSEGWIYYSGVSNNNKIYKVTTNGTNNTKLIDDRAWYINISDGWIYYTNASDEEKLYKVKTDGTENIRLSDDKVMNINVIDDWVYYRNRLDKGLLYRVRKDGTDMQKVE